MRLVSAQLGGEPGDGVSLPSTMGVSWPGLRPQKGRRPRLAGSGLVVPPCRRPAAPSIRGWPASVRRVTLLASVRIGEEVLRGMLQLDWVRLASLVLALALLPWQAVRSAVSPGSTCCRLDAAAGQCQRKCPLKASPQHGSEAERPQRACHGAADKAQPKPQCAMRSRCGHDHGNDISSQDRTCLLVPRTELPEPAMLANPSWPPGTGLPVSPPAPPSPPPQAACFG